MQKFSTVTVFLVQNILREKIENFSDLEKKHLFSPRDKRWQRRSKKRGGRKKQNLAIFRKTSQPVFGVKEKKIIH